MQNTSFATGLIFASRKFWNVFNKGKRRFWIIWGIARLTGRFLTVWLWIIFEFYRLRSFFLGIMGFPPSFLLLHPSFLEIEAQCKE